jgi:nicotinamidase/pyrazinamidase
MSDALLLIDVQYDFCSGGSLPVPAGDEVIPVLNQYLEIAGSASIPVFASRDWHPASTRHFASGGGLWPSHCVQGTHGAEFHHDLHLPGSARIVTTGDSSEDEGYSAFEGRLDDGTTLAEGLHSAGVTRVFVGGLATDYCVLHTVLDALQSGFETLYLEDGSRAVELKPGDGQRAVADMVAAGAHICTLTDFHPGTPSTDAREGASGGSVR